MSAFIERLKSVSWKEHAFALVWTASAILAVVIPVSMWNSEKKNYYDSYGYYIDYENQQREYEEAQNGNNNNGDDGNYYYKDCGWYNWACRKRQYNYAMADGSGDENGNTVQLPGWYIFLGGETEEMQKWEEENTGRRGGESSDAGTKFVYAWTLIMFAGIVAYGAYVLFKKRSRMGLVVVLALFAQFCLLMVVLVAQGVISADDRDLEDSIYGWYGQTGVLIAYTAFWLMLFSVIFPVVFGIQFFLERRKAKESESVTENDGEYQSYEEPQVQQGTIA